ncbi:MAG: leucine-rich repeat protein [Clostridia bacterium]|nr:leucine-rich repeat protein [Clostridia bacterium]
MKKKILFLLIAVTLLCLLAISVSAESYTPTFGSVITIDGIGEPTILDKTSRVVMTDGKTYPAYYILNDSTSFSPNFNKLNNALKDLGQDASYSRATVKALEIPEGIINLPPCYNAGGFFQGDKYTPTIEYLRLPSSLETMGDAAIYRINTLKVIDNFENTKVVDVPTRLEGLSSLQYIHLPNTVKTIPGGAFKECTSVEYIILGASIEEINTQAFLYAGKNSGKSSLKIYVSNTLLMVKNAYGDGPLQGSNAVVELYYTGTLDDVGMQQMINGTGIKKGASSWATVDASAKDFDKNATYTQNTIIYNFNKCDAFFGGVHTGEEINGCQVSCKNCGNTQEKVNPQHENKVFKEASELGYFGNITFTTSCENCGKVELTETYSALFEYLGYSTASFGESRSIVCGYNVNKEEIKAYQKYASDFEFGVIVAVNKSVEDEISPKPGELGVVSVSLSSLIHDYFDIKVIGIDEQNLDTQIVLCAYVIENDEIYYLYNNTTSQAVKGISYNSVSSQTK